MPEAADFTDDDVLVPALRRGDEAAFGWLLDRYSAPLLHLARTYVSNLEAAREAVQETWVAVITGIDRFEQRSSLKTWVYRILVNVARSKGVKEHRSMPFASLASEVERRRARRGPRPLPWAPRSLARPLGEPTGPVGRAARGRVCSAARRCRS